MIYQIGEGVGILEHGLGSEGIEWQ